MCKCFTFNTDKSVLLKVLDWEIGILKIEDIFKNTRDRASLKLNKIAIDYLTVWKKAKASRIYKLKNYVIEDLETP